MGESCCALLFSRGLIRRKERAMELRNEDEVRSRRRVLRGMVSSTGISAAALLGVSAPGSRATAQSGNSANMDELFEMARLRNYKTRRSSSWDRTGGNHDAVPVEPG